MPYKDTIYIDNLAFLYDPSHYGWIRRHWLNVKTRRACRKASVIVVPNDAIKAEVVRYYFIPKERITIKP